MKLRQWIVDLSLLLALAALVGCSSPPAPIRRSETPTRFEGLKAKAEAGDAAAQFELGNCYRTGEGVTKDLVQAASWYRKSADQGNAEAQNALGTCYLTGTGVVEDGVEAVKWLCRAADQGLAKAQCNLAVCYHDGVVVPKDVVKAVEWYRKAAEQGDAEAQYNLGVCCRDGEGLAKNCVEAYEWLSLASAQGHEKAKKAAVALAGEMTPEQLAAGERLARGFKPRKAPESGAPSVAQPAKP